MSLTSLFFGLLWWTSWAITSYMVVRCSRNRLNDSVEDMVQPPPIFPRAMNIMNPCCLVEPTIQRRMYSNLSASHQKIRKLQDMDQTWSDNTSQSSHRSRLRHHRCFGYHGCRFGWFKLQTVWTSRMMNYPSKAPVPKWPCATVNTGGQRSERPRSMDCLDYFLSKVGGGALYAKSFVSIDKAIWQLDWHVLLQTRSSRSQHIPAQVWLFKIIQVSSPWPGHTLAW